LKRSGIGEEGEVSSWKWRIYEDEEWNLSYDMEGG